MSQDWIKKINDSIITGDSQGASNNVKLSLENGVNAKDILMELVAVWDQVAKFYRHPEIPEDEEKEFIKAVNRFLVPIYKILFLLNKQIAEASSPIGCVVVGSMKGDHSLMKDVIALLFKTSGYKVVYQPRGGGETPESLLSSIKTANADALLLSVLQPSTFPMIGETVEALKREGLRDRVLVVIGGGAVTEEISRRLDCDVYADHPLKGLEAVERFIKSHERKKN